MSDKWEDQNRFACYLRRFDIRFLVREEALRRAPCTRSTLELYHRKGNEEDEAGNDLCTVTERPKWEISL